MNRLTGRNVIVTGAGSGIGRATALRLAREGAHVTALDIVPTGLVGLADELAGESGSGGGIITGAVDIADEES
ncbi:MAG: short-chain dehydrogenase/reductase, partial [Arthrobacter sp.]|nr:short-chain dehydrogenase/reductase [Arthrobacter sp.]